MYASYFYRYVYALLVKPSSLSFFLQVSDWSVRDCSRRCGESRQHQSRRGQRRGPLHMQGQQQSRNTTARSKAQRLRYSIPYYTKPIYLFCQPQAGQHLPSESMMSFEMMEGEEQGRQLSF